MSQANRDGIVRFSAAELDSLSRDELIDDMALPFLDIAEKIEAARLNGADDESWRAIFETNLFLWRFICNFLPRHFTDEVSADMTQLLKRISDFMTKATVATLQEGRRDDALMDKLVRLNLNMCDQILSLRSAPIE